MALTVARTDTYNVGSRTETITTVTGDNSYPTGGWALTPSQLGFSNNATDLVVDIIGTGGGFMPEYDYTNQKLKVYWFNYPGAAAAAAAEVTNATNLSTSSWKVVARSKYLK